MRKMQFMLLTPLNSRALMNSVFSLARRCLPGLLAVITLCWEGAAQGRIVFSCDENNDLYKVITKDYPEAKRYNHPAEAVAAAPNGSGVLILANGYPEKTTSLEAGLFKAAARKELRLFIEYPKSLPGIKVGPPRHARLERAVVASDAFDSSLAEHRILAIHDCHFVQAAAPKSHLIIAQVAGFDRAVFGLKDTVTFPLLFEHPNQLILVSTTKLSQFVTGRYAPKDALQAVWRMVFDWLQPGAKPIRLEWTPTVRPTYGPSEPLPPNAARQAIIRGIDWHTNANMLIGESWKDKYDLFRSDGTVDPTHPKGPAPDPSWSAGDGEYGLLEGVQSTIAYDGSQEVRWWRRSDSIGESAIAFALRSKIDGDVRSNRVATNLLDWLYFKSGFYHHDRESADFGLIRWAADTGRLYGDNDIKIILSCIGTAALQQDDRWDKVLLQNILANYRTSGTHLFRGNVLLDDRLRNRGWKHYWNKPTISYAPHYEAWLWASYLWLYDKTGYEPLLERTRSAIRMMMEAYPKRWRWTNGIQQERGRMLLTLAWLIRVDGRPEHREWLKQMATDMLRCQVASGAIREELGPPGNGGYGAPKSNAEYGTSESPIIQENGDPVADMLYTCNFAFLGLHEAYAATGDKQYREMADRLAEFLIRIQVRSETHPELNGGWFRTFDYERWDYWGSNADGGWGAWSMEVGWTQGWISTVLSMRELDLNLWDLTKDSKIARHWDRTRAVMLPKDISSSVKLKELPHAGVGKKASLATPAHASYPGVGTAGLTDGLVIGTKADSNSHHDGQWLGFLGDDLVATIDLGDSTLIRELGVHCLQSMRVGIYLPKRVEFCVSNDGQNFRSVATIEPKASQQKAGSIVLTLGAHGLDVRARYVRIHSVNVATIPAGHRAAGRKAWLFVDELIINPKKRN